MAAHQRMFLCWSLAVSSFQRKVVTHLVLRWSLGWCLVCLERLLLPKVQGFHPTGRLPGYGASSPDLGSVPGPPGAGVGFRDSSPGSDDVSRGLGQWFKVVKPETTRFEVISKMGAMEKIS